MGTVTDGRCPFDVAEIVIEVKRLTRNYAGLPAVDTVSFAIRTGEVLGYLGHNGAGKSTTVKVLLTLLTPLTLAAGAVFTWQWGAPVGITYFAFLTAATLMLIELLVVDFCKIPFTCSLPPFRNDTLAVMLGHLPGFAVFTAGGAQIASLMYRSPLRFWIFTTLVTAYLGHRSLLATGIHGGRDGIAVHRAPGGGAPNARSTRPDLEF